MVAVTAVNHGGGLLAAAVAAAYGEGGLLGHGLECDGVGWLPFGSGNDCRRRRRPDLTAPGLWPPLLGKRAAN